MTSLDVIVYGIDPCGPVAPSGEALARATWETLRSVADARPDLRLGFIDLRDPASRTAQRRLHAQVGRDLGPSDAPFLKVHGRVVRAADRQTLLELLAGTAEEAGSWEGFLATPGGTLEYMKRVDRDVDTFNLGILIDPAWVTAPPDFQTGWGRFVKDWKEFFKANQGFVSRTFADVYDDTKVYEQHLKAWRERWTRIGGRTPAAPPSPEADHNLSGPSGETIGAVGTAAVSLGVLAAVLGGLYLATR
jgi:hypothetical protein